MNPSHLPGGARLPAAAPPAHAPAPAHPQAGGDTLPALPAGTAPGVACPGCGKGRIRLTLESFLGGSEVRCGWCGLRLQIDKSACARLIPHLQELQRTTAEVERLRARYGAPAAPPPGPARRLR